MGRAPVHWRCRSATPGHVRRIYWRDPERRDYLPVGYVCDSCGMVRYEGPGGQMPRGRTQVEPDHPELLAYEQRLREEEEAGAIRPDMLEPSDGAGWVEHSASESQQAPAPAVSLPSLEPLSPGTAVRSSIRPRGGGER
jgi:hypothetical protein